LPVTRGAKRHKPWLAANLSAASTRTKK
jgi:hypothetical protein